MRACRSSAARRRAANGRLTDGASVERDAGVLACLDGYMNIAMEQTEVRERERTDARESARRRGDRDDGGLTEDDGARW